MLGVEAVCTGVAGHLVTQSPLPVSTKSPGNAFQPPHNWVHASPTQGLRHTLRSGPLRWLLGAPRSPLHAALL